MLGHPAKVPYAQGFLPELLLHVGSLGVIRGALGFFGQSLNSPLVPREIGLDSSCRG
jgi:hypothetical protein